LLFAAGCVVGLPQGVAAAQSSCPGYSICPVTYERENQFADARHNATVIAATESRAIQLWLGGGVPSANLEALLGKIMAFDVNLSVGGNLACGSCHAAEEGFDGPISEYNSNVVAYNGSVGLRSWKRAPISYAYVPFAPVLHFDSSHNVSTSHTFVGGTMWDMRATGLITGSPAADQAMLPLLSPTEQAMPDPACVVFRIAQSAYRSLFEQIWGLGSLAVAFPPDTGTRCLTPNSSNNPNPTIIALGPADRATVTTSFQQVARSIAAFEASSNVSAFTSKFDAVAAGTATFTAEEQAGFDLFRSKAHCHICHTADGPKPLFTTFAGFNLGIPHNPRIPFLNEDRPDVFGYVANPQGPAFNDSGLGAILAASDNPEWVQRASTYDGVFQVPSLRNAAKKHNGAFVKSFMHNGFFTDLGSVVHFYNTRDVLPRCQGTSQTDVGVTCWPRPDTPNHLVARIGNLGLTTAEESEIVAFLGTLVDATLPGFQ